MSDSIERSLGRIEGKQDMILDKLSVHDKRLNDSDSRHEDHDRFKNKIYGIVLAIGATSGVIATWLKSILAAAIHP